MALNLIVVEGVAARRAIARRKTNTFTTPADTSGTLIRKAGTDR